MDTHLKIPEWLKEMGYDSKIPKNFKGISNTNTCFIWEQLITRVKPKQNISKIRNQLIIKNLKECKQKFHNSDYRKELQVWNERNRLLKDINNIKERLCTLESKLEDISENNKTKYVLCESLKRKNQLEEQRTLLLNAKTITLNNEMLDVQEMFNLSKTLTPIEGSVQHNKKEVMETLNKCVAKLQLIINKENKQLNSNYILRNGKSPIECKEIDLVKNPTNSNEIKEILHKNNRIFLWNLIEEMNQPIQDQLVNLLLEYNNSGVKKTRKFNPILVNLYASHCENELRNFRNNLLLKKGEIRLQEVYETILSKLQTDLSEKQIQTIEKTIQEKFKTIEMDTLIKVFNRELNELKKNQNQIDNLALINKKLKTADKLISFKLALIHLRLDQFKFVLKSINRTRLDASLLLQKLKRFSDNLKWTKPLLSEIYSREINIFMDFPLENDQRYATGNLELKEARSISGILKAPYSPPEIIMTNYIKTKCRLEYKQSLQVQLPKTQFVKFLGEECEENEKETQQLLQETKSCLSSQTDSIVIQANNLRKMLNMWLEMPFKEAVPTSKTFQGKSFDFYDNLYENLYTQL